MIEDLASIEGFELKTFAVPAPGVEMAAQVLDITGRFKPDFVIAHLFGRSPSVSIKELKGKGYPLSKVEGYPACQPHPWHRPDMVGRRFSCRRRG